jgi:hypothetical protein
MRNIIIALALLTSTAAAARDERAAMTPPPPQYDVPYTGDLQVYVVPLNEMEFECSSASIEGLKKAYVPPGKRLLGCAKPSRDRCSIFLPKLDKGISQATQDKGRRHELGHCNGWRHP